MSAVAITPTAVSEAFWAMSNHLKALLDSAALSPETPGVVSWDVHMLPAFEVVTFEHTIEDLISASWITTDPTTQQAVFNEITFRPRPFDLLFAPVLHR